MRVTLCITVSKLDKVKQNAYAAILLPTAALSYTNHDYVAVAASERVPMCHTTGRQVGNVPDSL